MLYDDVVKKFLYDNVVKGNSDKTYVYYEGNLRRFGELYPHLDISYFNVDILKEYIFNLKNDNVICSVSIATYARAIKAFFMWCNKNGYSDCDFNNFKVPKQSKTVIRILSDDEMKAVFNCFNHQSFPECRNALILYLMLDCGLRRSECFRLRLADVLNDMLIVTGKGDKQRSVPVSAKLKELIDIYFNLRPETKTDTLLITRDAEALSDTSLKRIFKKVKNRTGIKRVHPHLLRHTFATQFLMNGGDIFSLQAILGHESLEMVKKYSHLSKTYLVKIYSVYSPLSNLDID